MKTKMTYREFKNIEIVTYQLKRTYCAIAEEWRNDLDKEGYPKLHSKTHKALNKVEQAINALEKISILIKHELD